MIKSVRKQKTLVILLGTIISCFIAFYNKYPLVYRDTGTYIASGFMNFVPSDRPIFYGLFLRHISLSASPWFVIIAQGFLTSWLLYLVYDLFYKGSYRYKNVIYLLTITFITLATGYSYNVSILMPDIFSPVALLALILLLFHEELGRWRMIFIAAVFIFSLMTHLSNIATFVLVLFFLSIYFLFKRKKMQWLKGKRLILIGTLITAAFMLIPILHYAIGKKFQFSSGSHVFQMNHLIENGILKKYLDENCADHDYSICAYKDELSWNFIWDENSVVYKTGGWDKNKKEYTEIIRNIYGSPKYWPLIIQKSSEYTLKQFFTWETTVSTPQLMGSPAFGEIEWHFNDSWREYIISKQNNKLLHVNALNEVENYVILFSLIICLAYAFLVLDFQVDIKLKWAIILMLLYGILNSAVCSNLSTVDARFQNRWVWLLPLFVVFITMHVIQEYKERRKEQEVLS